MVNPFDVSTNSDAFTWIGPTGASWRAASNWNDTTAGENPATTVPGSLNAVTIAGSTTISYMVIKGGGAAASVALTNNVDLTGSYSFGGVTIGSKGTIGSKAKVRWKVHAGALRLTPGANLTLGTLDLLDGQMTVGAKTSVAASGTITVGQASFGSGALTVKRGGSFTTPDDMDVVDGSLIVTGAESRVNVGGNLKLGGLVGQGSLWLKNGASLSVSGSVSAYAFGNFWVGWDTHLVALGGLTDIGGKITVIGSAQVASLTSSGPLFIDIYSSFGRFEVGSSGDVAAGSFRLDAGVSIAGRNRLSVHAGSVVIDGTITQTGGALSLEGNSVINGAISQTGGALSLAGGSVVVNGTISESGGTLLLGGNASGAGTIALGSTSVLEIEGAYGRPYDVTAPISGFAFGDGILFDNLALSRATYTSTGPSTGTLKLYYRSTLEETLVLTGRSYVGDTFTVSPTTSNGSEITLLQRTTPTEPVISDVVYSGNGIAGAWVLTGTAEAGTTITVNDGATKLGATVAAGGAWTFTADNDATAHAFKVTATDAAGNVSAATTAWTGTPGNDVYSLASDGALSGGDTFEGGGGRDVIDVSGHAAADTFVYSAASDSLNAIGARDKITGFQAVGGFHDLMDFSHLDPNLTVDGALSGNVVAAHSIEWLYNGGGAMIYVNDSASALSTASVSLMEVTLSNVTAGLGSADFRV